MEKGIDVLAPMRDAIARGESAEVMTKVDDGGAAYALEPGVSAFRGRVVKGVPVVDLAVVRSGSVQLLAEVARDLEKNGDTPCVKFSRDLNGEIDGVMICSAIALGEVA